MDIKSKTEVSTLSILSQKYIGNNKARLFLSVDNVVLYLQQPKDSAGGAIRTDRFSTIEDTKSTGKNTVDSRVTLNALAEKETGKVRIFTTDARNKESS